MKKEQLEYQLNKGNTFGYNLTDIKELVQWLILSKRKNITSFFERFCEADNPIIFREQFNIKEQPYNIWIATLERNVYEGNRFPNNEDYLKNENYTFSDLENVDFFLTSQGLNLEDIKWSSDIEFL